MKKFLLLVILSLGFTMMSCGNDLEKSFEKMEELESYRMEITMSNIPILGSMTMIMKVDGDMIYASDPFSGESYSKIIYGEEYAYIKVGGGYILAEDPKEDSGDIDSNILNDIDYGDFEETSKGEWTLKSERIYLDDEETSYMENVVILLNDDGYVYSMTFEMLTEGMKIDVEIEISEFNEAVVELPH